MDNCVATAVLIPIICMWKVWCLSSFNTQSHHTLLCLTYKDKQIHNHMSMKKCAYVDSEQPSVHNITIAQNISTLMRERDRVALGLYGNACALPS